MGKKTNPTVVPGLVFSVMQGKRDALEGVLGIYSP